MRRLAGTGLVVLLVACGGGDDDDHRADAAVETDAAPPDAAVIAACLDAILPGADHRQYVVDRILVPASATMAQQLGLDLDGDPQARPDNALGQILSTLSAQADVSSQEQMDAAIVGGTAIQLVDLDTAAREVRLFAGGDCDAPPDPLDNFDGDELFHVLDDDPADPPLPATLNADDVAAGPGTVTVPLVIVAGPPISLPLAGARIEGTFASDGITDAKLGGAIREADLDAVVLPAMASRFQATVDEQCSSAPPDCCPPDSTGELLLDLFDDDADCAISEDEIRTNDLISSLLAPDVDLFDADGNFNPRVDGVKDSLSLGVGLTGVTARFALP